MAEVLTKLDHDDFAAINPTHLLKERWRQEGPDAPLACILARYRQVSDWILTMVLTEEEVGERARVIEMLIELADKFVDLQNLHGTIAVVAALAHGSIKRLRRTWALVWRGGAGAGSGRGSVLWLCKVDRMRQLTSSYCLAGTSTIVSVV